MTDLIDELNETDPNEQDPEEAGGLIGGHTAEEIEEATEGDDEDD